MFEFRELFIFLTAIFGALLLILGFVTGVLCAHEYVMCTGLERATGIETRYDWACYAKVDGKWVPANYVWGDAHEMRVKEQDK